MASKYRTTKPKAAVSLLHDLAQTILKEQPEKNDKTTIEFVQTYFDCKKKGKEFVWNDKNSRIDSRHSEYPVTQNDFESALTDDDSRPSSEIN